MANFTPEEISQFLAEFFDVVGKRQYVGARYVPTFGRKNEASIAWDNSAPYEPLTIVLYQGNSYTSRQYVPAGVDISDTTYWALTGNYNAQVEQYRAEMALVKAQVDATDALIPKSAFSAASTVKDYIDQNNETTENTLEALMSRQTDQFNNGITAVRVGSLASAYSNQGFCVASDGYIYACYYNYSTGVTSLSKFNNAIENETDENPISTITLSNNNHGNSICEFNGKLYISSTGTISNHLSVVNLNTFTQESDIVLPYHGITDATIVNAAYDNSHILIIGMGTSLNRVQVYDYGPNFNRASVPVNDWQIEMPIYAAYAQSGAVYNNCYFHIFSGLRNIGTSTNRTYLTISPIYQSVANMPIVLPIGLPASDEELESLTFFDGNLYVKNSIGTIYRLDGCMDNLPYYYNYSRWANYRVNYAAPLVTLNNSNVPTLITLPQHIWDEIRSNPEAPSNVKYILRAQLPNRSHIISPVFTLSRLSNPRTFMSTKSNGFYIFNFNFIVNSNNNTVTVDTFYLIDFSISNGDITITTTSKEDLTLDAFSMYFVF